MWVALCPPQLVCQARRVEASGVLHQVAVVEAVALVLAALEDQP